MTHVRPLLEGALSVQADGGGMAMLLGIIAKAPQHHYDALVKALYTQITFTSPGQTTPTVLATDEALAFKDLDMAHILLLDVRAVYVNFLGSWDVLRSEWPRLNQISAQLSQETSTPSSTTP